MPRKTTPAALIRRSYAKVGDYWAPHREGHYQRLDTFIADSKLWMAVGSAVAAGYQHYGEGAQRVFAGDAGGWRQIALGFGYLYTAARIDASDRPRPDSVFARMPAVPALVLCHALLWEEREVSGFLGRLLARDVAGPCPEHPHPAASALVNFALALWSRSEGRAATEYEEASGVHAALFDGGSGPLPEIVDFRLQHVSGRESDLLSPAYAVMPFDIWPVELMAWNAVVMGGEAPWPKHAIFETPMMVLPPSGERVIGTDDALTRLRAYGVASGDW